MRVRGDFFYSSRTGEILGGLARGGCGDIFVIGQAFFVPRDQRCCERAPAASLSAGASSHLSLRFTAADRASLARPSRLISWYAAVSFW